MELQVGMRRDTLSPVQCSAIVFVEKLFTQRNIYGAIAAICKNWQPSHQIIQQWDDQGGVPEEDPRKIELLEQYGNYIKLRLSKQ